MTFEEANEYARDCVQNGTSARTVFKINDAFGVSVESPCTTCARRNKCWQRYKCNIEKERMITSCNFYEEKPYTVDMSFSELNEILKDSRTSSKYIEDFDNHRYDCNTVNLAKSEFFLEYGKNICFECANRKNCEILEMKDITKCRFFR